MHAAAYSGKRAFHRITLAMFHKNVLTLVTPKIPENSMKLQKGFTLIELMIAVVILGILAAIAIPAYSSYVIRGKIPDATSNLAAIRTQMEQSYQDNRTYVGATACANNTTSSKYFTFSCAATATTYLITATGTASMTGFTYTIDQSNTKQTTAAPAGWGPTSTTCWITKQGGAC